MQQEEAHSDTTNTCGCVEFSEVSQDVEAEAQLECWPSQDEVVEDKIVTTSAGDVHNVGESIVMRGSVLDSGAGGIRCQMVPTRGVLCQEKRA